MKLNKLLANILSMTSDPTVLNGTYIAQGDTIDLHVKWDSDYPPNLNMEKLNQFIKEQTKLQEYIDLVRDYVERLNKAKGSPNIDDGVIETFQDWYADYGSVNLWKIERVSHVDEMLYHMLDDFIFLLNSPDNDDIEILTSNLTDTLYQLSKHIEESGLK